MWRIRVPHTMHVTTVKEITMQKTSGTGWGGLTLLIASALAITGVVISVAALYAGGWAMLGLVYGIVLAGAAAGAVAFYRMLS